MAKCNYQLISFWYFFILLFGWLGWFDYFVVFFPPIIHWRLLWQGKPGRVKGDAQHRVCRCWGCSCCSPCRCCGVPAAVTALVWAPLACAGPGFDVSPRCTLKMRPGSFILSKINTYLQSLLVSWNELSDRSEESRASSIQRGLANCYICLLWGWAVWYGITPY